MSLEDLQKMLEEQENFLKEEFGKIEDDLKNMRETFEELNNTMEEEEAFLRDLQGKVHQEEKALEVHGLESVVEELLKHDSEEVVLEKIEQEISRISSFSQKLSNQWGECDSLDELKGLLQEFELLKKRWNLVRKEKKILANRVQ